jgi:hypothetical protein
VVESRRFFVGFRAQVTRLVRPLAFILAVATAGAQQPASPEPLHTVPTDTTRGQRASPSDTTIIPPLDQGRAVDAEMRTALYELMTGEAVAALSRLRPLDPATQSAERHFLIAECYYRLGMDDSLRAEAATLGALPEAVRFQPLLHEQLLLADYRDGDYAGAVEQSKAVASADPNSGVTSLLAGLAAYRLGQEPVARSAFEAAQAAGGPYKTYAQYMLTLMSLKADTAHGLAAAMVSLDSLLPSAQAPASDELHLTLAQLAFEGAQYDRSASEAALVPAASGLRAPALLTGAWATYRAGKPEPAGDLFATYARDYPELPARDEGRLMSAQIALQLHHDDSASHEFRAVADSVSAESQGLGPNAAGLRGGARFLVNARVADVLLLGDVAGGKAVTFPDSAAAGIDALRVAVADAPPPPPAVPTPSPLSVESLSQRLDAAGIDSAGTAKAGVAAGAPLLRRVVFMPPSDASTRGDLERGVAALRDADVGVALADQSMRAENANVLLQVANLKRMRELIQSAQDSLRTGFGPLAVAEDSLARVTADVDSAYYVLHRLIGAQAADLRGLANENTGKLDSVQQSLRGSATSADLAYIQQERETAETYRRIADEVDAGLDSAIAHNPAFALRDTVRQRGERTRALIVETRAAGAVAAAAVDSAQARVERGPSEARNALRGVLVAAVTRRDAAANALVVTVDRELTARGLALAAAMRRDLEAAEFGSATASFFRAIAADSSAGPAADSSRGAP